MLEKLVRWFMDAPARPDADWMDSRSWDDVPAGAFEASWDEQDVDRLSEWMCGHEWEELAE